jgi:hypothetical protein
MVIKCGFRRKNKGWKSFTLKNLRYQQKLRNPDEQGPACFPLGVPVK